MLCVAGQSLTMPPCPRGHVWSVVAVRCVRIDSPLNDCPPLQPGSSQRHGVMGSRRHKNRNSVYHGLTPKVRTTHVLSEMDLNLIEELFPSHPCTFLKGELLLPHPHACHWFYNCSLSPLDRRWDLEEPLTLECPYPQLFSLSVRACRPYKEVICGDRPEYKAPCAYREHSCSQPHCRSCQVRLASCEDLEDGVHPFPGREWTPWFVVCKDGRTMEQGNCQNGAPIFSPTVRSCVTSDLVPKRYGGVQPMCLGRPDGYHPDETGVCHSFFRCEDEAYKGSAQCPEGSMFNPETISCELKPNIPPCGTVAASDIPVKLCRGREDGFYADPYGRCSLYYQCKLQHLSAYLKCPLGSFNPTTKSCDQSLQLPSPCGLQPNPCQTRSDGTYSDLMVNCMASLTCRMGYVSRIDPCPEGRVFDDITKTCQYPEVTEPPCGIAPSCKGKADGRYPAVLRGCQHYFTCARGTFQGYDQCQLSKGGFFFDPYTGKCDFPQNICPPCGNKPGCSQT
ncbi:uncharacterized protein LOC101855365 [Aplysia californica]|uniref:Uncharacterized protein LOC101855365 n=1 Tax=Aplysia californica TaxID=6500 RepID=A0ABM0K1W2_APLCA|nr:uncharacterized protein LOC101855365 [Aplysia californica]